MLNKVILIGRLSRDPEVRFLPSGMQVTSFSIAVGRSYKDRDGNWQEETYFFDIDSFGNLAERLGNSISKGYQVLVEGSLRQDKWETPSGEKRSKVKIVADRVSILSKPGYTSPKQEQGFTPDEDAITSDLESDEDVPF